MTISSKGPSTPIKSVILIKNSYCNLLNFPTEVLTKVKTELTYKNEEAFQQKINILKSLKYAHFAKKSGSFSPYLAKKLHETGQSIDAHINQLKAILFKIQQSEVTCLLEGNQFPTGLLGIVKNVIGSLNYSNFILDDTRERPEQEHRFKWKKEPKEPRYYQNEVADILRINERGVVESCVASGKTDMMKETTFDKRVTTLIVVPSSPLLTQISDSFEEAFGKSFVQTIKAEDIKKGIKKLKPIRVTTVHALASLQKAGLLQELLGDVKMVLFDEFHHAASKSYTDLLRDMEHIYYRYGFTGTFLRNDSKTLDMWGVLGNQLYYYPPSKAIADGYITKPIFEVHSLPGVAKLNYQKEYDANYCGSKVLLQAIKRILDKVPDGKQVLVLVDRKEKSGEIIQKYLQMHNIKCSYVSGDDKSKVVKDAIKDFNSKKIQILVASTVLGEGIDLYSTDHLILATGGKSEIKIVQAIGRAVRLAQGKDFAYVYDFKFTGTKFMEKHYDIRSDIYTDQFGGEIRLVA